MRRVLFDIEANAIEAGLVTEVWSIVLLDLATEAVVSVSPESNETAWSWALDILEQADVRVGHNIGLYDLPALASNYPAHPRLAYDPERDEDTLVMARLARPDLKSHKLAAWGERLGSPKGDPGTYERWTPAMQAYCEQDVQVNLALYRHLTKEHPWLLSTR